MTLHSLLFSVDEAKERVSAYVVVLDTTLTVPLTLCPLFALAAQETINVYNWGEYISDGSDDSLDTIAAFEDWYKATYGVPVKVNYDTYASNEDMYAKLKSGAVSYDVVIPSDYMIARMEAEDMLLPLNELSVYLRGLPRPVL